MQPSLKSTLIGSTAILMWSTLALFTALSGPVPPFQLIAMSFPIGFLIGLVLWFRRGEGIIRPLQLPGRVWLLGIYGLFGFHFCYFLALKNAPPVEANLINYSWPLLIVVFSSLLPGERLRWFHLVGAGLGFMGAALLVTKGRALAFEPAYTLGYLAAVASALIWGSYSGLSRLFGSIPTDSVGGFCGVTAVLAAGCHFLLEKTVWPGGLEWLAIICLGLGPVGAAFFTWDHGMKHGNIKVLGAFAYAAPLLSTLLLIVFGLAQPTWIIAAACLFIVGGAVVASGDFYRRRSISYPELTGL